MTSTPPSAGADAGQGTDPFEDAAKAVGQFGEQHAGQAERHRRDGDLAQQQPVQAAAASWTRPICANERDVRSACGGCPRRSSTQSPTMLAIRHGTIDWKLISPIASTSTAKIAPVSGVPNTAPNPAAMPAISSVRRVDLIQAEPAADGAGDAAAHLHRRPFASGRPAEQMRDDRADQHQRRHPARHAAARLVDLLHDEVCCPLRPTCQRLIQQPDPDARHGEQEQQPRDSRSGVGGPANLRGLVQRPQKHRHGRANAGPTGMAISSHLRTYAPSARCSRGFHRNGILAP